MADNKRKWNSLRAILSVLTVVLVGWVVYENWADIVDTFYHLRDANGLILLLLVPEQLFMYYACGQIFFSYLKHRKNVRHFSQKEMLSIATELNFVNRAVPAGGIGGLAFLTYRMLPYGVTAGQASFLYLFRYSVTTVINYVQALIAILVLLLFGLIPSEGQWIIPLSLLMNMAVFFVLWFVIFVAGNNERIQKFSKLLSKFLNWTVRFFTLGRRKEFMRYYKISKYFADIHENVKTAKENKKYLKGPAMWGVLYSFCEVSTYWIVAISLGRPELLAFIMVGESIGSVFDGIVPYGLYEVGMAGVMIALGVDFPTATIVTVMTRVSTLLFTIVSGSIPYYKAIRGKRNG